MACCLCMHVPCTRQIGLSIEPADVVTNLQQVLKVQEHDKLGFAFLVAGDLFKYVARALASAWGEATSIVCMCARTSSNSWAC